MKRLAMILALGILAAMPAGAQAHSVTFTIGASSTVGVSYHVWRAPCSAAIASGICPAASEGAFAVIATTTTLTYTDTTVVGNTNYSYKATAFCPTTTSCAANFAVNVDSSDSPHLGAAIPPDPVSPPTSLTLGTVAMNVSGSQAVLSAAWQDAPKNGTEFWRVFDYYGRVVSSGSVSSDSAGSYSVVANFTAPGKYPLTFQVCDRVTCKDKNVSPS